jgi:hypothetical protein
VQRAVVLMGCGGRTTGAEGREGSMEHDGVARFP